MATDRRSGRGLRVGYDLDGCVYDATAALRLYVHRAHRRPLDTLPEPDRYHFAASWGFTEERFAEVWREAFLAGTVFVDGDPIPGAVEAARAVADAGHEIHVVTARAIPGAEAEAEAATAAWLDRVGFPYATLTLSADKTCVPVDVFAEDSGDNYDRLEAAGRRPWLHTRPWNASHPGRRFDRWEEFPGVVAAEAARLAAV